MQIIYPMFAMVILTFVVGLTIGAARLVSVRKHQVDARYYKLMSGYMLPDYVLKLGRNFSNLLEVPLIFYAVCILF